MIVHNSPLLLPIFLSLASFGLGYRLGSSSLFSKLNHDSNDREEEETHLNSDTEDEQGLPDGDLGIIKPGLLEACKLVRLMH